MNNKFIFNVIFIFGFFSCNIYCNINRDISNNCIGISNKNQYLYLDGSYETLIDNGLRCFELNSIPRWNEKLTRIWHCDNYDTSGVIFFRLKLFQFGVRSGNDFANFNILEWKLEGQDLRVSCIKKFDMFPKEGWKKFSESLRNQKLDSLHFVSANSKLPLSNGFDFIFLQYLAPHQVTTINLSNRSGNLKNSDDEREIAFLKLLKQVHCSFGLKITEYKGGEDILDIY